MLPLDWAAGDGLRHRRAAVAAEEAARVGQDDRALAGAVGAALGVRDAGNGEGRGLRAPRALDALGHRHRGDGRIVEPEVQVLGRPRLVGQTRRRVLARGPRHRHRVLHEGVEGRRREVGGVGRRGALAHENADAEGLAARFLQRLDLALADRDRELGAFGDQEVGRGSSRLERFLEQVFGEVTRIHDPSSLFLSGAGAVGHCFLGHREHGRDAVRVADVEQHPLRDLARHPPRLHVHDEERLQALDLPGLGALLAQPGEDRRCGLRSRR